jgi:FecR protein
MQIINFKSLPIFNRFFALLVVGLLSFSYSLTSYAELTLTHLSGQVQIRQLDGGLVSATPQSQVKSGESILTGKDGYVRIKQSDGGEIFLRPNTEFIIESYHFEESKPKDDNFIYRLIKGGLRTVTGLIGKRGNRDAYVARSVTATIGVRGTSFDIRVCQDDCGTLQNGSYYALRSGSIEATNELGSLVMTVGQVSFVGFNEPPILLPRDPGIGFTPPASFPALSSDNGEIVAKDDTKPADNSDASCEIR